MATISTTVFAPEDRQTAINRWYKSSGTVAFERPSLINASGPEGGDLGLEPVSEDFTDRHALVSIVGVKQQTFSGDLLMAPSKVSAAAVNLQNVSKASPVFPACTVRGVRVQKPHGHGLKPRCSAERKWRGAMRNSDAVQPRSDSGFNLKLSILRIYTNGCAKYLNHRRENDLRP